MWKFNNKNQPKESNLSENKYRIVVKKLMGGRVPVTHLVFMAQQIRDKDFNLKIVNNDQNFKDDVTIIQNKIITDMRYRLNVNNDTKEKQKSLVKDKIKEQELLLKSIKDGFAEINNKQVKVNYMDEQNKLDQYKVLYDTIELAENGSYEEIDIDGYRKISYKYEDGILYPYFHTNTSNTLYPDMATKRKIYKSEQELIDQEYRDENKPFLSGWKQYLVLGLIAVMIITNVYYSVKLNEGYQKYDESNIAKLTDMAEGSAIKCAYWYTQAMEKRENYINESKYINNTQGTGVVKIG